MSRTLYPIHVEPVSTAKERVDESKWHQPFSTPRYDRVAKRIAIVLAVASGAVISPWALTQKEAVIESKWHQPFSEPKRFKPRLTTAEMASGVTITLTPERTSEDKWHQQWRDPVQVKPGLGAEYQQTIAAPILAAAQETITLDKWLYQWTTPAWSKPGLATRLQQFSFHIPAVPTGTGDVLFAQTSYPASYEVGFLYQSIADPIPIVSSETVTVDKWFRQFSEPGKKKTVVWQQAYTGPVFTPVLSIESVQTSTIIPYQTALLYQSIASPVITTTATITVDEWFNPLSEPQRKKPAVAWQQSSAFVKADPFPEGTDYAKWGRSFSDPVRTKIGLRAALQQSVAAPVLATTEVVTLDKWFALLSEPQIKKGLKTALQPYRAEPVAPVEATVTDVISSQTSTVIAYHTTILYQSVASPVVAAPESITLDKWYRNLSTPVWLRQYGPELQSDHTKPVVAAPEQTTPSRWYKEFGTPVWKRSYHAPLSPFFFRSDYLVPAPYVDPPMASWSYGFSLPVRVRTSVMTASQSTETAPVIPQPNPPPPPGLYTVSGLYVIDQFTDNTVVYNYDGRVSHRTN